MSRKGKYRYKAPAKRGYQVRHLRPELLSAVAQPADRVPPLTYFGHKIVWGEPGIVEFSTIHDPKKW